MLPGDSPSTKATASATAQVVADLQPSLAVAFAKHLVAHLQEALLETLGKLSSDPSQGDATIGAYKAGVRKAVQDVLCDPGEALVQSLLHQAASSNVGEEVARPAGTPAAVESLSAADEHAADHGRSPRKWTLRFNHKCEGQGCPDLECKLCKHNPFKRCKDHFAPKYLVGDTLAAKCGAPICVELGLENSDQAPAEGLPEMHLELFLLNGVAKGIEDADEDFVFDELSLLDNNKGTPLLVSGSGGRHNDKHRVCVDINERRLNIQLPSLQVTDSSEAMLPGRKSTFRVVVVAVRRDGLPAGVKPLISHPFVVATRRIKGNIKEDFPTVDDPVGKLEHIGKQTEDKLRDLKAAARNCNMELHLPYKYTLEGGGRVSIQTVGQFRQLMKDAEMDTHLRKQLLQVLKMNSEQWSRAYEHAMRAVDVDNRLRKWYSQGEDAKDQGLLFPCKLGKIDLTRPVGLLQRSAGGDEVVTVMDQLSYGQREQVAAMLPQAVESWAELGHVGWDLCEVDYEAFIKTGDLTPPSAMRQQQSDIARIVTRGDDGPAGAPPAHITPFASAEAEEPRPRHAVSSYRAAASGGPAQGPGLHRGSSSSSATLADQAAYISNYLMSQPSQGGMGNGGQGMPTVAVHPQGGGFGPADSAMLGEVFANMVQKKLREAHRRGSQQPEAKRQRTDGGDPGMAQMPSLHSDILNSLFSWGGGQLPQMPSSSAPVMAGPFGSSMSSILPNMFPGAGSGAYGGGPDNPLLQLLSSMTFPQSNSAALMDTLQMLHSDQGPRQQRQQQQAPQIEEPSSEGRDGN